MMGKPVVTVFQLLGLRSSLWAPKGMKYPGIILVPGNPI